MRIISCDICQSSFSSNHSQAKYCSEDCVAVGKRKSWNKYSNKNRLIKRSRYRKHYLKNTNKIIKRTKAYQATEKGREAQKKSDTRQKIINSEKILARDILGKAIKSNEITKVSCEICGNGRVHGHHNDYSEPLKVQWLCAKHHGEHHRKLRKKELYKQIRNGAVA